jgi:hypothetical protein
MTAVLHVVLVQWRPDAGTVAREAVREGVRGLAHAVPGIIALEEGPSAGPEGLERGNDYGFVVTFDDAAARDAYLPHPEHLAAADRIGAAAAQVTVFDVAAR